MLCEAMASKQSRAKARGLQYQSKVTERIRRVTGLSPIDCKSTGAGAPGMDVQLSEAGRRVFPYAVECKNVARLSVPDWLRQAEENSEGLTPVVVFRIPPSSKSYAIVEFDHFLELSKPTTEYLQQCSLGVEQKDCFSAEDPIGACS